MNAADILKYGHLTVLQAIDNVPEALWNVAGACGTWSNKDIVAHLASYEQVLVDILASCIQKVSTPALDRFIQSGSQFNDIEVGLRQQKTVQEVLQEYNDAHNQVMSLIVTIPTETLRQAGTLPWYGTDYALDDVIVYMYYGHQREHSAQIVAFCDRLNK
jgi:hypothetical protein